TGNMFPSSYQGNIFLAQHGSWNRSTKIGYRLMLVKVENGQVVDAEVFADGWLDENEDEAWGRPVDVLQLSDGSLLVSDDQANAIYRISYEGS
ncbi:MAG: sorbosone dehydrogenase family protein, partial [Bacteroidetes bacterium]|nr:sorbosone dehydrogenase family protein [Bacteroidota bacterium]